MPLVSVIIPVKNAEATIKQSVESVLAQEYRELEIICVINDTTDRTPDILLRLQKQDSRIRLAESAKGIVAALNQGLRISSGPVIARQDADDVWLPEKLRYQMDYLLKNPGIDILGTQMQVVNNDLSPIGSTNYPLEHDKITMMTLMGQNSIGHPSVVFRRSLLDKCGGYSDMFPLAEDMELWCRAFLWHRAANLPQKLVLYRKILGAPTTYDPKVPLTIASWYRKIYGMEKF